jgi:hypothetical protein
VPFSEERRFVRRICGVVKAWVTSQPTVVGSSSTNELLKKVVVARRVEHWSCPGARVPATKRSDVVKARVTSTVERSVENRRGCGFENRLLREKQ